jgi:glycosyltransferase involved in cell wall biosynthesis
MAVNIANGLSKNNIASYLITTRYDGSLIHDLNPVVVNKSLNRRNRWNPLPILGLIKFISSEKITLIHAHTTSVFIASVMGLVFPKIKLVWHDHYGELERIEQRPIQALKRIIHRFSGIISVNESLRAWAQNNLGHSNVIYLPNFIEMGNSISEFNQAEFNQMKSEGNALKNTNAVNMDVPKRNQTKLNGPDGFKIICVANLRPQKDHLTLIRAFAQLSQEHTNVSLHLVGAESDQSYADQVKSEVIAHGLNQVYFYGAVEGVSDLLQQAQLGVLSSVSEGLPMALLEYAAAGLPIVTTDVGACREVVANHGMVVPSKNPEELYRALSKTIMDYDSAIAKAEKLKAHILEQYSEAAVIPRLIEFYKML